MEKIREFLDVKAVSEIKRVKKDYTELSYEVFRWSKSKYSLLISDMGKF